MYMKCGKPLQALHEWDTLMNTIDVEPNIITYLSILKTCAAVGTPAALQTGEFVYAHILENKDVQRVGLYFKLHYIRILLIFHYSIRLKCFEIFSLTKIIVGASNELFF